MSYADIVNNLLSRIKEIERNLQEDRERNSWSCYYDSADGYFSNPLDPYEKIPISELEENSRRSHP